MLVFNARGQSHSRATCQPSTPVLAARAARREKLGEARSENRTFHCDPTSESAVFAMHAAVQTPKVVRQPAHHCELGLRPRGAQQRRLRGQNVPTPVRSAVFRSRSSGGRCEGFENVGPPCLHARLRGHAIRCACMHRACAARSIIHAVYSVRCVYHI